MPSALRKPLILASEFSLSQVLSRVGQPPSGAGESSGRHH